jgi:hypothetical protein
MPSFHSGHFRIFWDILFDAADRYHEDLEDKEIVIISPWISDVTTAHSGWSDTALASAFEIDSGNIESLSFLLGELVQRGFTVKILTLSTVGKWLPKAVNKHLDNEQRFMKQVNEKGVRCFLRNNLHMKYVKTPFSIFCGSVNISFNGLSGRNQEAASLFYHDIHDQEYRQRLDSITSTFVGAKDYFSPRIPITDYIPPKFSINMGETAITVDYQAGPITPRYSELNDGYPMDVAEGFIPQGRINGTLDTEEKQKSFVIQLATLTIGVATRSIEIVADETIDGYKMEQLTDKIFENTDLVEGADESESLPTVKQIRELLLPDAQNHRKYVQRKLGLEDENEAFDEWTENAGQICSHMEYLTQKVEAGLTKITVADITMLTDLTHKLDDGFI